MDGLLEQELLAALNTTNGSELLDATTLQTVINEIIEVSQRAQNNGNHPVLLCSPSCADLLPHFRPHRLCAAGFVI